jgi:hypothetical protein
VAAWAADVVCNRAQDSARRQPSFYRDRLLRFRDRSSVVRRPYPRVVASPDAAGLKAPMVLATFHMGPLAALGGLTSRLPGPVCVLLGAGEVVTRRATYLPTLGGEAQRVAAVMEALRTLRGDGYALVVVDGFGSARLQQTALGREVSLSRGAFALARLAGAPIVPVAVRWRGPAVEILAGQVIEPADEASMAKAMLAWLEGYLREYPGELSHALTRLLALR